MELQDTLQSPGRNLATYDFSTLYTSIPHEKLKDNCTISSGLTAKERFLINCNLLIETVDRFIDNTYVTIGTLSSAKKLEYPWVLGVHLFS